MERLTPKRCAKAGSARIARHSTVASSASRSRKCWISCASVSSASAASIRSSRLHASTSPASTRDDRVAVVENDVDAFVGVVRPADEVIRIRALAVPGVVLGDDTAPVVVSSSSGPRPASSIDSVARSESSMSARLSSVTPVPNAERLLVAEVRQHEVVRLARPDRVLDAASLGEPGAGRSCAPDRRPPRGAPSAQTRLSRRWSRHDSTA